MSPGVTNDDGTVNAEINRVNVGDVGEDIEVQYLLPSGETKVERYSWPEKATDQYKIVRLRCELGFSVSQVEAIEGERIKYDGGVVFDQSRRERVREKCNQITFRDLIDSNRTLLFNFVMWPLIAFVSLPIMFDSDFPDVSRAEAIGVVTTVVWLTAIFTLFSVLVFL